MVNSTEVGNCSANSLQLIEEKCKQFWSLGTSVYEAGLVGDIFSLEKINEKKFYIKADVEAKVKTDYFEYLVKNKHLHRLNRIDHIGDVTLDQSTYNVNPGDGNITVHIKALEVILKENGFIEDYLKRVFGVHWTFIKEWLAMYVYSNYQKLPTLILTGDRGVGKNTFAEAIQAIFPTLSETVKDLEGNFNGFAEKKLLTIDEATSTGKLQYQFIKKSSGQKYQQVNKKYQPPYQVLNNMNIIILSNDESPIYVERDEMPTDVRNNQFFVYRLKMHDSFDADLQQKLIDRMGHYIRTELKEVHAKIKPEGFRYSIAVPITEEEKKLFTNSVSDLEEEADRAVEYIENRMNDQSWSDYKFLTEGFLPSRFLDDIIKDRRISNRKVIQNLQKRQLIANGKAIKHQVDGQRHYAYQLGSKWIDMMNKFNAQKKSLMCLLSFWIAGIWIGRLA